MCTFQPSLLFTETVHIETAARLVIAHAINTSHVFVYAKINGGSGVSPLSGCVHDTRRHVVLVDLCLLDVL